MSNLRRSKYKIILRINLQLNLTLLHNFISKVEVQKVMITFYTEYNYFYSKDFKTIQSLVLKREKNFVLFNISVY